MAPRSTPTGNIYDDTLGSGTLEADCHPSSGLRVEASSHLCENASSLLANSTAVGAATITGFSKNIPITRSVLSTPSTPCLTLLIGNAGNTSPRSIQARLRGYDQFGNYLEEITPVVTQTQAIYLFQTVHVWFSMPFAVVTQLDINGSNLHAADTVALGQLFYWDRCQGTAYLYFTGGTSSGNFTLEVQEPGSAVQTTANIAYSGTPATLHTNIKNALEALSQFAGYTVTVTGILPTGGLPGAGVITDPVVIKFDGSAPRDQYDLAFNDVSLDTGAGVLTGLEYIGHDNLAIGLTKKIQAYRPDIGLQTHPDVLACQMFFPGKQKMLGKELTIVSNTQANPSVVTVTPEHGYETGDTFFTWIRNSNSNPVIDGPILATALAAADQFSVPINVTTAPGTQGTAGILVGNDQAVSVNSAGTTANPVGSPGFRLGVNATDYNWRGGSNKLGIYLDSSRAAGAHELKIENKYLLRTDAEHIEDGILHVTVRASAGTGAIDSSSSTYPQG